MNHLLTILDPYPVNRVSVWGGPWLSLVDRRKACLHQLDVHSLFVGDVLSVGGAAAC